MVRVGLQNELKLALCGTYLTKGQVEIGREEMPNTVIGGEAQTLRYQLRSFLETALLAVEIGAAEERGCIGRAGQTGDGVPDARQEPQKVHVV